MTIRTHNTLTGKKEPLQTIEPGHVKLYVCGITSYDYCHIGHARSSLAFDMIVKYLKYRDYKVTFVRNFTDIDDKIITRANEQNTTSEELANRFIQEFYTDMDKLGIDRPDIEPKATEHIAEMVSMIEELISKGKAYEAGGDVYYIVDSFPEYGKLSKRNIEDMKAGARISVNEQKQHPMDFVLWKASKPGEPKWQSPWGEGRPGWHIECSAMSKKYLGESFDIHGGGQDLIFPHHENEIAQSEGANCKPFAKSWIHHGFVTIKDEKMSKSLGNFLTIRDILNNYHPEILRFFIFSTHYRNPLDFSEAAMQDATTGLVRLYECVAAVDQLDSLQTDESSPTVFTDKDLKKIESLEERFQQAMDNDFNTAQAQGIFFDTIKTINKVRTKLSPTPLSKDIKTLKVSIATLKKLAAIMGLLREDAATFLHNKQEAMLSGLDISAETIEALILERNQCRIDKNWSRSDEIRDELLAKNIELKDGADGTAWIVKAN
ncbi:cysteine--tRNA ligase [Desulforhopalus sp. IMCC35007]|uniref:cysteine--tRNA ligase n=1 Tax=Desulforhopalus sp. IMCC35007 TaxID=2569543 RepID=UPI0010ADFD55|nr:cysteine--tRNA ligase [Desulforhopalus sp. IMCC35007]TKB09394.1 cysteine--tRNA ligase [Desulforhopalus sp. IMCC35007]